MNAKGKAQANGDAHEERRAREPKASDQNELFRLLGQITEDNRHVEVETGGAVGREFRG